MTINRMTPLRYPGGKALLAGYFASIVQNNKLSDGVYVEAFAGGAGVAMALLIGEYMDTVFINDIDVSVWAFWRAAVDHTREFCGRIAAAALTPQEWRRQKETYRIGLKSGVLDLGFATFYLNRTNRSGILGGGMIGGKEQTGEWKMDARFNREELIERILRIARYKRRIHITNEDAVPFLQRIVRKLPKRALLYLDPPYYLKGQHLYRNYFTHDDHALIASTIQAADKPWIVSYDDHREIRKLYKGFDSRRYQLGYSARDRRVGSEIMFFSPGLMPA